VGIALIGLGARFTASRPGYGLSLQGAGAGILYLATYAAFRLYAVLPDEVAIALLVAIAGLTVVLALRADSEGLAGLAIAGGFLAPMLTETRGAPAPLFGYFAILNGAIFALAWRRAWRALNVLGFVFTFALGLFWGHRYYTSDYFATVEPFLVLFFTYYVAISILEARRGALETKRPVDGLLVFGVPLVGFVLQAALVNEYRYGAAWSALAIAAVYGALHVALRGSSASGLALLGRAHLALAVVFVRLPSRSHSTINGRPRCGRSWRPGLWIGSKHRPLPADLRWWSSFVRAPRSLGQVGPRPMSRCSPMGISSARC
jgi:uncharacterized membrane protein